MSAPTALENVKSVVQPFEVNYLLAALEMGKADESVLRFLQFMTKLLPTKSVTFLHVLPKLDLYFTDIGQNMQNLMKSFDHQDEIVEEMRLKVARYLDAENGPLVHFSTKNGNPLEEVLQEARISGADLLVVGQRSGSGNHGILARNLVRKSSGNTLIIPEKSQASLKTIVVPVDFSPHSLRSLELAVGINRSLEEKAKIICINVFELPAVFSNKVRHSYEALKQLMEEDRMAAFKDFLSPFANDKEHIEMALIEQEYGNIGTFLYQFCEDHHADLIVLGAKGHSKVGLLLLGSVTEKLLTLNQNIPTLVVK